MHRFIPLKSSPAPKPDWRWLAHRLERELEQPADSPGSLFRALNVSVDRLPAVWTVDFIMAEDGQYYGEFGG